MKKQRENLPHLGITFTIWFIMLVTGILMGVFLEQIHNLLLSQSASGKVTASHILTELISDTFRSSHRAPRLMSGWGSSLSSVFNVFNLVAGTLLVTLSLHKRSGFPFLALAYAVNVCLFFFFLYFLSAPLLFSGRIAGMEEGEIVTGATWVGNLLFKIQGIMFVVFVLFLSFLLFIV